MSKSQVWDETKNEFRILGKRHALIDVQALCDHLDSLVGVPVAEVIIHNHEFHLGKEDAERLHKERQQAAIRDIIDLMIESDRLSGTGLTSVILPEDPTQPYSVQILNPCVKATGGAAKSLLLSYWAGVLSYLFGGELDLRSVTVDEVQNFLRCQLVRRRV